MRFGSNDHHDISHLEHLPMPKHDYQRRAGLAHRNTRSGAARETRRGVEGETTQRNVSTTSRYTQRLSSAQQNDAHAKAFAIQRRCGLKHHALLPVALPVVWQFAGLTIPVCVQGSSRCRQPTRTTMSGPSGYMLFAIDVYPDALSRFLFSVRQGIRCLQSTCTLTPCLYF